MASINRILEAIGQSGALAEKRPVLEVTPTRLYKFNTEVLKIGGIAGGRVYELYAPNSAGKSTLAQIISGDYQSKGKIAAYFDAESTTQTETNLIESASWMQRLGVDTSQLIMPNFGSAEDLFHLVKLLIVNGVNLISIDTVAVLRPEILIYREAETVKMNENTALAKGLTAFFNDIVTGFSIKGENGKPLLVAEDRRKWLASYGVDIRNPEIHKLWYYDCSIIGINHAKTMIGVLYGDPLYTPGGDALGFHSSVRLGMTKPIKSKEKIKVGDYEVPLYRKTRIAAAKNKLAAPFGEISLRVYQDGRVVEDVPFFVIAEQKGLISTTARNVTIVKGEYAGTTMKKIDFEQWVAENPEVLEMVDSEVETYESSSPTQKIALGGLKKPETSEKRSLALSLGILKKTE